MRAAGGEAGRWRFGGGPSGKTDWNGSWKLEVAGLEGHGPNGEF